MWLGFLEFTKSFGWMVIDDATLQSYSTTIFSSWKSMVHSPLIRPYFLGGWHWGGTLDSHDFKPCNIACSVFWCQTCLPKVQLQGSKTRQHRKREPMSEVHSMLVPNWVMKLPVVGSNLFASCWVQSYTVVLKHEKTVENNKPHGFH